MGALPWYYFIPYEPDIEQAFRGLRLREFQAGRYYPVVGIPQYPVLVNSASPGAKHRTIEEAVEAAGPNGTRSILDMKGVSLTGPPRPGIIVPLPAEKIVQLYGSSFPTRPMIENNMDFFAGLDRGQGVFVVAFRQNTPDELLFAGYSYD